VRCFILPLAPQNRLVWRCFSGKNNVQCALYEIILAQPTRGCQAPVVSVFTVSETYAIGVETVEKDRETRAVVIETGVHPVLPASRLTAKAAYSRDVVHRFRSSPHQWTTCRRNRWSASVGTGGRHALESLVGMGRIVHTELTVAVILGII